MAVKKAASRKRSTTKRATTARSTTKRATKARKAATPTDDQTTPADQTAITDPAPTTEVAEMAAEVAEPARIAVVPAAAPRAATRTASGPQPSRFTGDHYLHATSPKPPQGAMRRPGKWLIFVSRSRVDALWEGIRRAVERGRLGHAAQVSTALPHPEARDPKKHVICVYTSDQDDAADVRRVRDVLRGLGVTWRIPYKSHTGGHNGDVTGGPATKYYE
jgi:hypothetical protein